MLKNNSKRGEWIKIQNYANEYGWRMVIDAVEKAAKVKEAEQMISEGVKPHKRKKKQNEARIIAMAQQMGVKLNG